MTDASMVDYSKYGSEMFSPTIKLTDRERRLTARISQYDVMLKSMMEGHVRHLA